MRFRPRKIDYHTEACLLLEDDRNEPRRIIIVAPPDHNQLEEENNIDPVEETEHFKETSDQEKETSFGSNDAKRRELSVGSTSSCSGQLANGICTQVAVWDSESSSPDSSKVMGFDYGDEMSNCRPTMSPTIVPSSDSKSNDIIETTKKRKDPPSSPPGCPKSCDLPSPLAAQANRFDGHHEFHGAKRSKVERSSSPDTVSNVTKTKCPMRESMIDATETKHPMQTSMKTSFYDIPWLLSFISNIRRVANRKRLPMTPWESLITQKPANRSRSVSIGYLFTIESWIVDLWSHDSCTAASQRAGQQLDRIQILLYSIGKDSPNPALPQENRRGRFSTSALGTRDTRREALEREKLALVVYQGKGKEEADIHPEELQRAWQACFAIAQNMSMLGVCNTPAGTIPEQEACQQQQKKRRRISPTEVHDMSEGGNRGRGSSLEMERKAILKHTPVPRKESAESIVNKLQTPAQNSNIGERIKHAAPMSRSERYCEDGFVPNAPKKMKRRRKTSTADHARTMPPEEPAFMEQDSKASALHEERIRKREAALREEGYRKKEAELLKQFGLEVENSSPPTEQEMSDDRDAIHRFVKSAKMPRRNSIVVPDGKKLRCSSRRTSSIDTPSSKIQMQLSGQEFRSEADQHQGVRPARPSNSRPVDDNASHATRVMSDAQPLRYGNPSSFDCEMKREKSGNNPRCHVEPKSYAVRSEYDTPALLGQPDCDVCTDPNVYEAAQSSSHEATLASAGHELQPVQANSSNDRLLPLNPRPYVSNATMASVMSKAPPLRAAIPSSMDGNLKRQNPKPQNTAVFHTGGESGHLVQPTNGNSELNRFPASCRKHKMAIPSSKEVNLDERIKPPECRIQMDPSLGASHRRSSASLGNPVMLQTEAVAAASSRNMNQQHDAAQASTLSEHKNPANITRRSLPAVTLDRHSRDVAGGKSLKNKCEHSRMVDQQGKNHEISDNANMLPEVPDSLSIRKKETPIPPPMDFEIAPRAQGRKREKELKRERKRKRKEEKRERKERKRERKKLRERTNHVHQESAVVHSSQSTRIEHIGTDLKSFDRPKAQSSMGQQQSHRESKPAPDLVIANSTVDQSKEIRVEDEPDPVTRLLCSEAFYERYGQLVTKLASGEWDPSVNGMGLSTDIVIGNEPRQRIQFFDSGLVDIIGVDVELGSRAAFVVSAVSTWPKGDGSKTLIERVIKVAVNSRYKCIEVFVCVDIQYDDEITSEIDRLQNSFLRLNGCPQTMITIKIASPSSLPCCLARSVLATGFTYAEEASDLLSQVRAQERIRFLLSIVPSLSLSGALKSMEIFNSREAENVDEQDVSNIWFGRMLGKKDTERQRQQQLATTRKDVRDALNPESLFQMSFVVNLALDHSRSPK